MISLVGPSRRTFLTLGSLPFLRVGVPSPPLGVGPPPPPRASADGPARGTNGFGKARSVLLLYLQGSPSHIDTWDPKPDAPEGIRGEFKAIDTSVPGVRLTEVLPRLARQAHPFALTRPLEVKPQGLANHGASIYM